MIPIYKPWITHVETNAVQDAIESGWVSSKGPYVEKFEDEFAKYIGTKYALTTNNGTAACHLALLAAGIGPGDEVIIPDLTFVATANAVKYCGATPVLVDVNPSTWNIDPDHIISRITPRTKAIFCVHLLGNPCNYNILLNIKNKYGLLVIEDACEAIGAYVYTDGAMQIRLNVGNLFDVAAFSFYGNKTMTTGEGGMVTTNNPDIYRKALLLKGQAQTESYFHCCVGYNYRMTNICAALGCAQLSRIEQILAEKERIVLTYSELLPDTCVFQTAESPFSFNAYWMVGVHVGQTNVKRLKSNTVFELRQMFHPIHTLPPYKVDDDELDDASRLHNGCIMLPSYPELTRSQIIDVCNEIKQIIL